MNAYADIVRAVTAMATLKTAGERRAATAAIVSSLRVLESERPPATDALSAAYETGALEAVDIAHVVRREYEASFKEARYTAAGVVLNGLENYGQAMLGQVESRVSRHLSERRRKEARR
jgi:hypothetical protein